MNEKLVGVVVLTVLAIAQAPANRPGLLAQEGRGIEVAYLATGEQPGAAAQYRSVRREPTEMVQECHQQWNWQKFSACDHTRAAQPAEYVN